MRYVEMKDGFFHTVNRMKKRVSRFDIKTQREKEKN